MRAEEEAGPEPATADSPSARPNISSRRVNVIIAGLWLSLFISAMDTTIITTALGKISSEFGALNQATWLVTAYLLTYNAFLIIAAKFSDIWGLKTVLIASNIFFLIFSMACAGAQTMVQLIIFRALQGIGGSGLYSLVFVTIAKLFSPEKMGFYSGVISSVFALANLLGPVLGGVIVDNTTWRWIFWINGPIVGTGLALLFFSMPGLDDGKSNRDRLQGFDIIGGMLSVGWPIPLLFALQEGGVHYEWNGSIIIGTLTAGIAALLLFGAYEAWITYRTTKDAIFPFRFLTNPMTALLLLSIFLQGMPFYASFIQLPQRFLTVNHTSAERAGILLLPVALLTPVGAMVAGSVMGRLIAAEYVLITSAALVCVGIGLLSSLPVEATFWTGTYGYEILTGFALGLGSPGYYFLLYTSVPEKDHAVGTGVINMLRTLGGAVAIAICSALHHSFTRSRLSSILAMDQIVRIEESNTYIGTLPSGLQQQAGRIFGQSYNRQFQVLLAFCCLNFLVAIALGMVRKRRGVFGMSPEDYKREENEFNKKQSLDRSNEDKMAETGAVEVSQTPARDISDPQNAKTNEDEIAMATNASKKGTAG